MYAHIFLKHVLVHKIADIKLLSGSYALLVLFGDTCIFRIQFLFLLSIKAFNAEVDTFRPEFPFPIYVLHKTYIIDVLNFCVLVVYKI